MNGKETKLLKKLAQTMSLKSTDTEDILLNKWKELKNMTENELAEKIRKEGMSKEVGIVLHMNNWMVLEDIKTKEPLELIGEKRVTI